MNLPWFGSIVSNGWSYQVWGSLSSRSTARRRLPEPVSPSPDFASNAFRSASASITPGTVTNDPGVLDERNREFEFSGKSKTGGEPSSRIWGQLK